MVIITYTGRIWGRPECGSPGSSICMAIATNGNRRPTHRGGLGDAFRATARSPEYAGISWWSETRAHSSGEEFDLSHPGIDWETRTREMWLTYPGSNASFERRRTSTLLGVGSFTSRCFGLTKTRIERAPEASR